MTNEEFVQARGGPRYHENTFAILQHSGPWPLPVFMCFAHCTHVEGLGDLPSCLEPERSRTVDDRCNDAMMRCCLEPPDSTQRAGSNRRGSN